MFRRPNTTPLEAQHSSRQPARVRCRGPKQPAGAKHTRHFLDQHTRVAQMLENLSRGDHVKLLRAKLRMLELTVKYFEAEFAHMFAGLLRNFQTLRIPTVLACGKQEIACAATDIEQAVLLAVA